MLKANSKNIMADKRNSKRKKLIKYLEVIDRDSNKFIGHISDFSDDGLMLFSKETIELNTVFQLRLLSTDKNEHIDFEAKCMWCNPDPTIFFYDAGFKFTNIDPAKLHMIKEWFKGSWIVDE